MTNDDAAHCYLAQAMTLFAILLLRTFWHLTTLPIATPAFHAFFALGLLLSAVLCVIAARDAVHMAIGDI